MSIFTHKQGNYLLCDGSDIYYEVVGNLQGKPLILLHGGLGCMLDFNGIIDKISSEYMIVGIDLRGHGKSTIGDRELSYAQYQRDIETVLKHLDIDSFSLLGFSDGGIVSYRLAASDSSKVEQLITLGSQWRLEKNDPSIGLLGGVTSADWSEMFPEAVSYYNESNPKPNFELLVKRVKSVWMDTMATGYPYASVSAITCATLIMRGDDDELFSLQEAVELVQKIDKSTFMNIPFAEHEAHKDYPEVFCSAVNKFLTQE